jgi:hypothetical protein
MGDAKFFWNSGKGMCRYLIGGLLNSERMLIEAVGMGLQALRYVVFIHSIHNQIQGMHMQLLITRSPYAYKRQEEGTPASPQNLIQTTPVASSGIPGPPTSTASSDTPTPTDRNRPYAELEQISPIQIPLIPGLLIGVHTHTEILMSPNFSQ